MFLKKIHIQNFKCLADIELSFEKNKSTNRKWTLILGENGTGKSNLLKAIALVTAGSNALGELIGNTDSWIRNGEKSCSIIAVLETKKGEERSISLKINQGDTLSNIISINKDSLHLIDDALENAKLLFIFLVIGMMSATTKAQNIDDILKKHADAIGGMENWAKIKTMKMEMVMKMQGMEIPIVATQVNCTAMRTDITVMGMSGYSIITKTNGWNFMPFNGQTKPEPMTEDILKSSQDELCLVDKLFRYKETGDKVEYLGTDDVDGTECIKLKLTDSIGKEDTYFLDAETYLLLKKTVKAMVNGQVMENSASMGNYQKLEEGIIVPMSTKTGGGEMEIKKITVNPAVDENIFKLPN